jgi:hypothetical protein
MPFQRWFVGELMRPVVLAGSILEKVIRPLLRPRAIRSSIDRENQFRIDIKQQSSFLFDEYEGNVVGDVTLEHPLPLTMPLSLLLSMIFYCGSLEVGATSA